MQRIINVVVRLTVDGESSENISDGLMDMDYDFLSNTTGFEVVDMEIVETFENV